MPDPAVVFRELVAFGALQSLPVLLLAWLLDRWFARRGWTEPRRVVWALAALELLLPPPIGAPVHALGLAPVAVAEAAGEHVGQLWRVLMWTWLVGGGLFAGAQWLRRRRMRRGLLVGARPLPAPFAPAVARAAALLGLRRRPEVLVRPGGPCCVLGAFWPIVLLDEALLRAAPDDALEHALLHELAHVRRRDPLRAGLLRAALAAWWFHPTAWLLHRRLQLLRECATDRLVTRVLGGRAAYCRTLVAQALASTAPLPAPALARQPAEVVQRVRALQQQAAGGAGRRAAPWAAAAALAVCCVPLTVPVAATALPFGVGSLDELPGCLTRRYFVLSQLAAQAETPSSENLTKGPR